MIENDGYFTWSEPAITGGINQQLVDGARTYRLLRNLNWRNVGGFTKDLGIRRLSVETLESGNYDTAAGLDCHFSDGTQRVVIYQRGAANASVHTYDISTRTYADEGIAPANTRPWMGMFANKLHLFDGTTLRTMDSTTAWATPGEATYSNPCTMGTVYAERLIAAGNPNFPYSFFVSGVRDASDWDASLAVTVSNTQGEAITCLGTCGSFLIVGGETFTRAYFKGTAGPRDWDPDTISNLVGPVNFQSFVEVPRARGNEHSAVSFFWGLEGPMMLVQRGRETPALIPVWEPLTRAVREEVFGDLPALDISEFANIEAAYEPTLREVRFAVQGKDDTQRARILALSVDSALAYAQDPRVAPLWRLRDNDAGLPVSTLFSVRVDATEGQPSSTGYPKVFCAQDGVVYEMDAAGVYLDQDNTPIPFRLRRDGYNGIEDGVRSRTKSVRGARMRIKQTAAWTIQARVIADNEQSSTAQVELGTDLNKWTNDTAVAKWGDGQGYNKGGFTDRMAGFGAVGKSFEFEVFDDGAVRGPLELSDWELDGYLEDRR